MPMRILIVEDSDARLGKLTPWFPDDVRIVWAKSAGRAIGLLKRDRGRVYDGIMLDFDLPRHATGPDDRSRTGSDVVASIITYVDNDVPILVHSMNPKGGHSMYQQLSDAGFSVLRMPMKNLTQRAITKWLRLVAEEREAQHG